MTWFKVDDKLHSNSKVRAVMATNPAAMALWLVAGSWSSDNLSDGFVPESQLPWLLPEGSDLLARELVRAKLWKKVRGGYKFHDWEQCNPTATEVAERRRKRAEAGRKGGVASGKTRSKGEANASASGAANANPDPSRPDPPPSKEGGEGARVAPSLSDAARPLDARSPSAVAQEEDMTPAETEALIARLRAEGVSGRELARRVQAEQPRPFERKGVVDVPAPPLPPVRPDNGLARLIAAAEEWGSSLVEPPCQDE